jgi:hypothetical protein
MRAIYEICSQNKYIRFVDKRILGLMTGKTSDPCYMRFPSNTSYGSETFVNLICRGVWGMEEGERDPGYPSICIISLWVSYCVYIFDYRYFEIQVRQILFSSFSTSFFGLYFYSVLYSTLLHLSPLRYRSVWGCWDGTQDCCDFGIGRQTLRCNHSSISHPRLS